MEQPASRFNNTNHRVVDIYSDFDGVISPFELRNAVHPELVKPTNQDEPYPIDRRGYYDSIVWSSEMLNQVKDMIDHQPIRWHWLTSNERWMVALDQAIGINHDDVDTEAFFDQDSDGGIVGGDRLGAIAVALTKRLTDRTKTPSRGVVWMDDTPEIRRQPNRVDQLRQMVGESGVDMLVINPDSYKGISRQEMKQVTDFIAEH